MPNSKRIDYYFNRLNMLYRVEIEGEEYTIDYTSRGSIDTISYPNGVIQDYDYTVRNWVENISVSNNNGYLFNEQYEYDDVGNLNMIHDLKYFE